MEKNEKKEREKCWYCVSVKIYSALFLWLLPFLFLLAYSFPKHETSES